MRWFARFREFWARVVNILARAWSRTTLALSPSSTAIELARLNDNLESVMLHFRIPRYSRAELSTPPEMASTVFQYDEAEAAYVEWKAEYDSARGRMADARLEPDDAE
jgi:hypothetical protein